MPLKESSNARGQAAAYGCGIEAARQLARPIGGQPVLCATIEWDRFGRLVAVCRADGHELAALMV